MTTITCKLPDELARELDRAAKTRRVSRSAVIRDCLEQQLAGTQPGKRPSCLDLLGGLVGSQPGAADASTSARHLKDFGRGRRDHR